MTKNNLYIDSMINTTIFKEYCIKRKLRRLNKQRDQSVEYLILVNPSKASACDKIEDMDTVLFEYYDRCINRYQKLLNKIKESE